MRLLRTAYSGFLADADMLAYWRFRTQTFVAPVPDSSLSLNRATADRTLIAPGSAPSGVPGFDPSIPFGAANFSGFEFFVSSSPMNAAERTALTTFSQAVAYDFENQVVDGTITEYSGMSGPGPLSAGLRYNLSYSSASRSFRLTYQSSASVFNSHTLVGAPASGVIGFDVSNGARRVDWFANGVLVSTTTTALGGTTGAASSASARWVVGASVFTGSAYNNPGHRLVGNISEIGIWRRNLGVDKHRELYASTVQPWDDSALLEANTAVTRISVEVEDSNGVYQNLSNFDGADWVNGARITEDVDSPQTSANVSLRRRRGKFSDLSPLNSGPDYAGLLGLRRSVRIVRSVVPQGWNLRGWEGRLVFDGLIDSWDMSRDTIDLRCTDRSVGLQDAFIADTKAYQYPEPGTSVEVVQQQLLTEYFPVLGRGDDAVSVGYKGFGLFIPQLYTEAGTSTSPKFRPNPQVIRFNDVSSGPVLGALTALTDQTGYDLRFKYHDPWGGYRLMSSDPRRKLLIPHTQIQQVSTNEAVIEFAVPHGLGLDSNLTISGASPFNTGFVSVSSVMDYYRVVASAASFALGLSVTAGSVSFDRSLVLRNADVIEADQVKSDIDRIRNHAIVRYQRVETTATMGVTFVNRDVDGLLRVVVAQRVKSIDPDDRGVTFALTSTGGGVGTAASLFGSYSGNVTASQQLTTNVPSGVLGVAGEYPGTLPFSVPLMISSQYIAFKEVVSTATASMQEYGLLPVSVYEGSNLGIDTQVEAQRLADTLISDLSTPTVDMTITTRCLPLGLHDVVVLAEDPKGRWSGSFTAAITSISESYDSGQCFTEYGLRRSVPSRGFRWIARMMVSIERPAPSASYNIDMVRQADRWRPAVPDLPRSISFRRPLPDRREMGLRHDQTEVWLGDSAQFVPTDQNRAGMFRGERIELTSDGQGNSLTPGNTYFARFADRDIFGNLSQTTGLNTASAATVPGFTVRYLTLTQSALAVRASTTSYTADWSGFTPLFLNIDDGSDVAGRSHDNMNNYTTTSGLFRAGCDGIYSVVADYPWLATKSAGGVNARVGRFTGSMATVGYTNVSGASYSGVNTRFRVTLNETVYCNSGDFLRVEWNPTSYAAPILAPTSSAAFGYVHFALLNQR